jgi:hypothetical protein
LETINQKPDNISNKIAKKKKKRGKNPKQKRA